MLRAARGDIPLILWSLLRAMLGHRHGPTTNLPLTLLLEGLAVTLTLFLYRSATLAMGGGEGYFSFIVAGECSIALPLVCLRAPLEALQETRALGVLEVLASAPSPLARAAVTLSFAQIAREALRVILMLVGAFVLGGIERDFAAVPWLAAQAAAIPLFLSLGCACAALHLATGRGGAIPYWLCTAAVVGAGVYFPTSQLPAALKEGLDLLSPFNLHVELSRKALSHDGFSGGLALRWLTLTVLALGLGPFLLEQARRRAENRGAWGAT